MKSSFDPMKLKYPIEIERELKIARNKLNDAVWDEDEELQHALQRQIDRLEMLKSFGETHDVPW